VILHSVTALSMSLNVLLIIVVLHNKCRNIGNYRYLLVSFAWMDLFTALLGHFTNPHLVFSEFGVMLVSRNLMKTHGFYENLGTRMFNVTFYHPFVLLTFQFVYRYYALVRPESTGLQFRIKFVFGFLIFLVYSYFASIPAYLASLDPETKRRFFVKTSEVCVEYLKRGDAHPLAMLYY
ncbi:hypothetical protein PENTCL1PPCAC_12624, partial [Pristionchus entomophagus]